MEDQGKLTKILYAEDDPDIQSIIKLVFELEGYEMMTCCSGQEAIDRAPLFKPQFILLDVMMPGVDGLTAYRVLKESSFGKDIPMAFMTAKVGVKEVEVYMAMGAAGVIHKPFDPNTLVEQIEAIYQPYRGG